LSRYLRLTRGTPGQVGPEGVEPLRLALWNGSKELGHVLAYSGAPGAQNFRTLAQERRGVLEPIPEGIYREVGPLEWAGGAGNYKTYWSDSLGPVVAQLYGERAIMLHLDANRSYAPGSAGCVCPVDFAGLQTVVSWWAAGVPDRLEVDWGLGTVTRPTVAGEEQIHRVKLYAKPGKCVAYRDGVSQDALAARLDYHGGKLGLAINGVQLPLDQIESVNIEVAYKAGK